MTNDLTVYNVESRELIVDCLRGEMVSSHELTCHQGTSIFSSTILATQQTIASVEGMMYSATHRKRPAFGDCWYSA